MNRKVAQELATSPLAPPETLIFLRFKEKFENKRVLDLGVGSGRTTRYLHPFCSDYLGIDLSPEMLAYARQSFPDQRFEIGDIRNIDQLSGTGFDFVLIAFNTIDVLDHEDRIRLLSSVREILTDEGILVFSTHNRSWTHCGKLRLPALKQARSFAHYLYHLLQAGREYLNHRRLAHLQRSETDYAIVTGSHQRSGLVYCIENESQVRQLRDAGFCVIGIYDDKGNQVTQTDPAPESYNLYFVCEKDRPPV